MRAKLAIGDSWFKEGGTAALHAGRVRVQGLHHLLPQPAGSCRSADEGGGHLLHADGEAGPRLQQHVEGGAEYRQMIQQFPDSTLVPRAKQRLREVQEVLAEREYQIGIYYVTRENYAGSIARLQTVVDTYPLYSKSDLALLTLGDSYAAEGQYAKKMNLSPAAKERLVSVYDDRAAEAYSRGRDALPDGSARGRGQGAVDCAEQAGSGADAGGARRERSGDAEPDQHQVEGRAMLLVKHGPSTIQASRVGEPTLTDPGAHDCSRGLQGYDGRPSRRRWAKPRSGSEPRRSLHAVTSWHRATANRRRWSGKAGGRA